MLDSYEYYFHGCLSSQDFYNIYMHFRMLLSKHHVAVIVAKRKNRENIGMFRLITNFIHSQTNEDEKPNSRRPEGPAPGNQVVQMLAG